MRRGFIFLLLCAYAATAQDAHEYDVVVVGGTGGGIAAAVRSARLGLDVLLVNYSNHLGGMVSGGIGVMDTLYDGSRTPLLDEFYASVLDYYRTRYGESSAQYHAALPAPRKVSTKRLQFEPHVAEEIIDGMVQKSGRIEVLRRYYPVAVERAQRIVRSVVLDSFDGRPEVRVRGRIFMDASYEGDLMALAGAEYRVGREDRNEFGEPHAGRIFSKRYIPQGSPAMYPTEARIGDLNLRPFQAVTQEIFAGSTGEGDSKVQAYHYRLCLTNDPANRIPVAKPAGYNPELVRAEMDDYRGLPGKASAPNNKAAWFLNFSGHASAYPNAPWSERRKIEDQHREFALSVVYYLQNDPAVPEAQRTQNRQWGLPKDEFRDNNGVPYEMYIREARRLVGRYVFTELDASLARGYRRAPIHSDSIAIGEWFLDSHEVSTERQLGSDQDGKIILSELTRPSQIPYASLLPKDMDNLLVPVCASSTHVGWGTIRLEPTWIHLGEAAAFAAAEAHRLGTTPGQLNSADLQRALVEHGVMISFFNDLDMKSNPRYTPAIQYLGAQGFFADYMARADAPLGMKTAQLWARGFGELTTHTGDPAARARSLASVDGDDATIDAPGFARLLETAASYWGMDRRSKIQEAMKGVSASAPLTRGDAARVIYQLLRAERN